MPSRFICVCFPRRSGHRVADDGRACPHPYLLHHLQLSDTSDVVGASITHHLCVEPSRRRSDAVWSRDTVTLTGFACRHRAAELVCSPSSRLMFGQPPVARLCL